MTHALISSSPAIDAGDPWIGWLTEDQRGYSRPADGDNDGMMRIDVGAYELQSVEG